MSTDAFTEAAADEAEELWALEMTPGHPLSGPERRHRRIGFTIGAQWARDHLATQEPTDAEQRARFSVESMHQIHGAHCVCGFVSDRARSRTEHIMTHYFAALSAARAARREETR